MNYFGRALTEENCGSCDNCLTPRTTVEGKELLVTALEAIDLLRERYKAEHIVDFLMGKETADIVSYQQNEMEQFGSGQEEDDKTWNAVLRQALIAGYLTKEIENYGTLRITPQGREFMEHATSFRVVKDTEFE